jgi:sigma-E factor negative regulatory protein RseB
MTVWAGVFLLAAVSFDAVADLTQDSQTTALKWLSDMRQAVSGLNYKGEVAYLKDKAVDSFQLFHSAGPGVEQERLIALNTPIREVVREGERVACYFPDTKSVFVENNSGKHSSLLDLPDDMSQLLKNYRLGLHGQEFVASRQAQVVSIEPRDRYRYARLIWVDTDSKLPIKFEMLDEDGQVAEQMVFTSLSVGSGVAPSDLQSSLKDQSGNWKVRQKEVLPLETLNWTLQDVPPGFQMASYTRMMRPPGDRSVEHLLLSDGLSSVSIYIEPLKGELKEHPRKIGAINARTVRIDDFQVTVMGEVPDQTIQAIAKGIRHQSKSPS